MVCTHEITCMHVVSSGAKHSWRCSILVQGTALKGGPHTMHIPN